MIDREINKYEQHHFFNLRQWKKRVKFEIFNDISENVILVQLMENVGYVDQGVIITACWVYYLN